MKQPTGAKTSDSRLILAMGALYALMQVITFVKIYTQKNLDGMAINLSDLMEERVVALAIALLYIFLIVKTTGKYLMANKSWKRIIAVHLVFAILISFLWYSTFIFVTMLFCPTQECGGSRMELIYWFLINFDKLFLLYLFTVSVTYTYYYVQRDSINQIQKSQIENQLLQTRLMMLKSQLHPHFLFNTLNSIASLIDIDMQKAKNMIADLGDLLRYVLDHKDEQIVTVEEEVRLLCKYVDIEKIRFSEDLDIQLEIDPLLQEAEIPSMLLQPLVENSIRHGFSRHHPKLQINIKLVAEEGKLQIFIHDDGKGFDSQLSENIFDKGTGLKNTFERLKSIYRDQFSFLVENLNPGVGNRIEIPLKLTPTE